MFIIACLPLCIWWFSFSKCMIRFVCSLKGYFLIYISFLRRGEFVLTKQTKKKNGCMSHAHKNIIIEIYRFRQALWNIYAQGCIKSMSNVSKALDISEKHFRIIIFVEQFSRLLRLWREKDFLYMKFCFFSSQRLNFCRSHCTVMVIAFDTRSSFA